jgi:hypothetical protein
MAINRLTGQDAKGASTTTSVVVSYPGATTSGNLLLATAYANTANAPAISGWTAFTTGINSNTANMGVFYKIANGTETSITATGTSATVMKLHLYEYSGVANPISLDVGLTANGTTTGGTSWATPSITTTLAADLIFGVVGLNGNSTSPTFSGLNSRQSDAIMIDGDLIPGIIETGFTGTASWSGTLKASAIIGAFMAATGGAPNTSSFFALF